MKASEHIAALQELIAKHGDLPMHIYNDEWQCSVAMVSVTHQDASPGRSDQPECFVVN